MDEGKECLDKLKTILSEWSIVAFATGALAGSGYHYALKDTFGNECGEGFVVFPDYSP